MLILIIILLLVFGAGGGYYGPYPLGSRRRGWYRTGDNTVDSPHRLHAWLVPLKVTTGDELLSRLPFSLLLSNRWQKGGRRHRTGVHAEFCSEFTPRALRQQQRDQTVQLSIGRQAQTARQHHAQPITAARVCGCFQRNSPTGVVGYHSRRVIRSRSYGGHHRAIDAAAHGRQLPDALPFGSASDVVEA